MNDTPAAVDASPTKRFFVRMLVRDIELVPAIVDLVDNSVDGAKRLAAEASGGEGSGDGEAQPVDRTDDVEGGGGDATDDGGDVSGLGAAVADKVVSIHVDQARFSIEDNCGGIELAAAKDYAFRFGRPEEIEPIEGEVGQFGVGLKRALFKLGQHFVVTSHRPEESFAVDVDVPDWLARPTDWTFPLRKLDAEAGNGNGKRGTLIEVDDLLPSVAAEFGEERFVQRLRQQIEFRHQAAIAAGLTVKLNGSQLRARPLALLAAPDLAPRVVETRLEAEGHSVELRLYAGFVELADEGADTDDPEQFSGGSLAGWYLVCNDRMLLFADKSRLTGWGQEVADYHPQYRRFRGYAYLTGSSAAMPWNTAKTAVDEDSPIWPLLRQEIVDALREARTVMNRIKAEIQERTEDERPVASQLAAAQPVALADLPREASMRVPPRPPRQPPSTRRIAYGVPTDLFDEVGSVLGVEKPADVGRRTFDYYYRREVED